MTEKSFTLIYEQSCPSRNSETKTCPQCHFLLLIELPQIHIRNKYSLKILAYLHLLQLMLAL